MPTTAVLVHDCGNPLATTERFRVGMAQTLDDVIECQRLRYLVFNCELGEGLDSSSRTGLDRDRFDFICDHLTVHDSATGKLAGTYRMQSGYRAKGNLGYYGEEFFDFHPFERIRGEVLELGRACVHEEYRNSIVLHMLWKGIAWYAVSCCARYLLGCSSISSQDENAGLALYEVLRKKYLVDPALRTNPVEERVLAKRCSCGASTASTALPRLFGHFRAHLRPAGDRPRIQDHRFPNVGGLAKASRSRANALLLGLSNGWAAFSHVRSLLESVPHLQDAPIVIMPPDDLDSDR